MCQGCRVGLRRTDEADDGPINRGWAGGLRSWSRAPVPRVTPGCLRAGGEQTCACWPPPMLGGPMFRHDAGIHHGLLLNTCLADMDC